MKKMKKVRLPRSSATPQVPRVKTGVAGLDDILEGGLTPNRTYLVEGCSGAGKTTLALQFLLEGVRQGEAALYVTLSETREEMEEVARSHDWSLDGIFIHELAVSEASLQAEAPVSLFHPSEVELGETVRAILGEVERQSPRRVVFDSLSELRLLAHEPLRYRRQILAIKQFFAGRQCTVLILDEKTSPAADLQLHSIAHGVLELEQLAPEYGAERRRLRVVKMRGRSYRGGYHDFIITSSGLVVFPRIVAAEHHAAFRREVLGSGLAALDELVGEGLRRGTNALIMGPAGAGKSTLVTQYAVSAARRGEPVAIFTFDEGLETLLERAAGTGMDLQPFIEQKQLVVQQIDPAELSPGEFAATVRHAVEVSGVRLLVIDSLNGYMNAMPEERFLVLHLHELLAYLGQQGVTTLLVMAQQGIVGSGLQTPVDVSYLTDTLLLLRFFELEGEVRKAISVIKKRNSGHEQFIRELRISAQGLQVGKPLRDFHGILAGNPQPSNGAKKRKTQAGETHGGHHQGTTTT